MPAPSLPPEVHALLLERVRTFDQLETLRLLHAHRAERWNSDAVGAALKMAPASADDALENLFEQELVDRRVDGGIASYQYREGPGVSAAMVTELLHAYSHDRVGVMKEMISNAVERVRGEAGRTFGEALGSAKKRER